MDNSCVIMQPTYLPWVGYFSLIHSANKFVFLDDVQFEKQSWQSRNFILAPTGRLILSIPIKKHNLSTKINQIEINDDINWRKKHTSGITQNYSKHNYFNYLNEIIEIINDLSIDRLIEMNVKIISAICKIVSIDFNPIFSSKFSFEQKKSKKLLNILNVLGCKEYISPIGSKNYIDNEGILKKNEINVYYKDYCPQFYDQKNSKNFISHLSIIDLIANIGPSQTRKHINY